MDRSTNRIGLYVVVGAGLLSTMGLAQTTGRQATSASPEVASVQASLSEAQAQERRAAQRAARFARTARNARDGAVKAQAEAVALGARIQQGEAELATLAAQRAEVAQRRAVLETELARERRPLAELTAALHSAVRRPTALALLQPGLVKDAVYLGAILDSTVPVIRAQTGQLRTRLDRLAALERASDAALVKARETRRKLARQRLALEAMAERQRIAARRATGSASREERRALVLAEQARDLDALVGRLAEQGDLRRRLAALPGPSLRPADPASSTAPAMPLDERPATASEDRPPAGYRLPVDGAVIAGFGIGGSDAVRLAAARDTLVVAPGPGRVVFAGPYRGFGRIVIVEHAEGWTSLVTELASLDVAVGQSVVAGSPLGTAGGGGSIGLELRRGREPVTPLDAL